MDQSGYRVEKFSGAGAYLTQWSASGGGLAQYSAVAVDPAGNAYIINQTNNRILKFAVPPAIAFVSDVGYDQGSRGRLGAWVGRSARDARTCEEEVR